MHTRIQHQTTSDTMNLERASFFRHTILAIAVAVGAFVAAPAAAGAQTQSGTIDSGVRCFGIASNGDHIFFLPGDRVTDASGNKWVCGPDGRWFRDQSSLTATPGTTSPTYTPKLPTYQVAPTKTAMIYVR